MDGTVRYCKRKVTKKICTVPQGASSVKYTIELYGTNNKSDIVDQLGNYDDLRALERQRAMAQNVPDNTETMRWRYM